MNQISLVHTVGNPAAYVDRDDLLDALEKLVPLVERGNIPILENAELLGDRESLWITVTNLDQDMTISLSARSSEEFHTTVPAKLLRDAVKKAPATEIGRAVLEMLPAPAERRPVRGADGEPETDEEGDVKMEEARSNSFSSNQLLARIGRANFTLQSLSAEDFPELPSLDGRTWRFKLAGSALWNAIDSVITGISTEETRYHLNGVYLHQVGKQQLAATATDGHRLFRQEIHEVKGIANMPGVIVPAKAMKLLHKLLARSAQGTVEIALNESGFEAAWDNIELRSKVVEGTFPDYARVIPTGNDKVAVLSMPRLVECINAVTVVSSERGRAVRLLFEKNRLTLTVNNPDSGSAVVDMECEYDADPIEIGFNTSYLFDMAARAAPDKTDVILKMADAGSPTLVSGSVNGWTGVLMPMRV